MKLIEPSEAGSLLRVNHLPPINVFFAFKKTLPVKVFVYHKQKNVLLISNKFFRIQVFGVKINGNGYSWLQSVTVNHSVKFIPILRDGDIAVCQVFLLQPKCTKVGSVCIILCLLYLRTLCTYFQPALDLATSLTSLGFAQVVEIPNECVGDLSLTAYHKNLLKIQNRSKSSRSGLWADMYVKFCFYWFQFILILLIIYSVSPPMWPIPQVQKLSWKALYNILPIKRRLPELVR